MTFFKTNADLIPGSHLLLQNHKFSIHPHDLPLDVKIYTFKTIQILGILLTAIVHFSSIHSRVFLLKKSSTPLARFGPRHPRSAALALPIAFKLLFSANNWRALVSFTPGILQTAWRRSLSFLPPFLDFASLMAVAKGFLILSALNN